ncbi:HAD hydrolase family protein, partial [Clostridium botulinum]
TINEAIKKGIKIVICTGRPYSGIKPYTEIMGLDTEKEYIISQNGSYVVNGTETEVVSAKYLKSKEVNDILYFLEQLDIGKILVTPEDYLAYNCKINEEMKYDASLVFKEIKKFDEDNERLDNLDVLKVMIMDKVEKIEHLSNRIPKVIIDNFYVVRSTPYLIE